MKIADKSRLLSSRSGSDESPTRSAPPGARNGAPSGPLGMTYEELRDLSQRCHRILVRATENGVEEIVFELREHQDLRPAPRRFR
jgi:hypothetical protein